MGPCQERHYRPLPVVVAALVCVLVLGCFSLFRSIEIYDTGASLALLGNGGGTSVESLCATLERQNLINILLQEEVQKVLLKGRESLSLQPDPVSGGGVVAWQAVKAIIVIPHGRVGSSWLRSVLIEYPGIMIAGEILEGVKGIAVEEKALSTNVTKYYTRTEHKRNLIRGAFPNNDPSHIQVRGFKAKTWCVLDESVQLMLINEVRPKIIYLSRRNLLKVAISDIRADQLRKKCAGQSNVREESGCSLGPTQINVPTLMNKLGGTVLKSEMGKAWLRRMQTKLSVMIVNYEDLLQNEHSVVRSVLNFLEYKRNDGKVSRPHQRLFKITNDSLNASVLNFEDIARAVEGSIYEPFLRSDQGASWADRQTGLFLGSLQLPLLVET